jgi:hypothetical protein
MPTIYLSLGVAGRANGPNSSGLSGRFVVCVAMPLEMLLGRELKERGGKAEILIVFSTWEKSNRMQNPCSEEDSLHSSFIAEVFVIERPKPEREGPCLRFVGCMPYSDCRSHRSGHNAREYECFARITHCDREKYDAWRPLFSGDVIVSSGGTF